MWKIFEALTYANPIEQKRLLAIALDQPIHSPVTARARTLALRYFELKLLEPAPELRKDLAVYRPDSSWMLNALLGIGGLDFEGFVATSLLEPFCDTDNPRAVLLKPSQCQSVLLQTQILNLITPSEFSAENFEEPARRAFIADQQLVEKVQNAAENCADNPPFVITMLRATNSRDWRSYLRALRNTSPECVANIE